MHHRHHIAAELQDDEPGVRKRQAILHKRLGNAGENGAGTAPERDIVHRYAVFSIGPYGVNLCVAFELERGLLDGPAEIPGDQRGAVLTLFHNGLGFQSVRSGFHLKILGTSVKYGNAFEGTDTFPGQFVFGPAQIHGAAAGELYHLRQHAITIMAGALGGGISVHGVLHESAGGRFGNTGRGDVAQSRELTCSATAETLLQSLTEILGDTVQFYLGIAVVNHADPALLGLVHLVENNVKVMVIVVWKENPVRILIEELPVVLEGIVLHAEARLHGLQYGIHIHFLLPSLPYHALVGGEAEVQRAQVHAIGRDGQPQHAQHSEHPAKEYEYLLSFHKIAKVRIF